MKVADSMDWASVALNPIAPQILASKCCFFCHSAIIMEQALIGIKAGTYLFTIWEVRSAIITLLYKYVLYI